MTYKTILFESCRGIARLTLNRPDRLNAFTAQMHEEVADALSEVEADPAARVLLLTASGRGFCAGQDLTERDVHAGPLDLGKTTRNYYNPLIRRLTALPLPVVCAVNGVAAGAGVNLALACDLVIACSSARFVQAFSGIGLVPDAGGTWALPHLIGQARALSRQNARHFLNNSRAGRRAVSEPQSSLSVVPRVPRSTNSLISSQNCSANAALPTTTKKECLRSRNAGARTSPAANHAPFVASALRGQPHTRQEPHVQ
jgi:enoyl-CoA hydratase/carnithine racemase